MCTFVGNIRFAMKHAIDIDGLKVHYRKSGQGAPMILMHGWGCSSDTLATVEAVASEHREVYNIDFPGFGDSAEPDATWGVEEYTRLVESFADRLGLKSPVLLGHSFGGRVALLYASRNAVDAVVLTDAAGVKPRRSLGYYVKVYSFKLVKRLYGLIYGREGAQRRIEARRARSGSADYAAASPRMRAVLSRVVNEDLCHVMPKIVAPTLLVWGEADTATPMRDARVMERLIPGAGLVSFAGAGHYSFLDCRAQYAAVLHSFLNSVDKD